METVDQLRPVFANGPMITRTEMREGGAVTINLGRGLFEADLVDLLGFEKRRLKQMAHAGLLQKTTTRYKGGWRNTYVLVEPKEEAKPE